MLPKQNQTLPARDRDNFLLNDKGKQTSDMRPKTREKLIPLNKSNLIDNDLMGSHTIEDKKHNTSTTDTMNFKKWNTNKGEWKANVPVGKPLNGLDSNNPYNPNWTKMVLKNHFDVNIEPNEEQQGIKWKIRKVKNSNNRRNSPERQTQEQKAYQNGAGANGLKHYLGSNERKSFENRKPERKPSRPITTLGDIPLGGDIIPAHIYLNTADVKQVEATNRENFDTNWLAQTMLTRKGFIYSLS